MRIVSRTAVQEILSAALDGCGSHQLLDTESIAALIRRTASFLCPRPATELTGGVITLLRPLTDVDELVQNVEECLDEIIAYGDLVETRGDDDREVVSLSIPAAVEISNEIILLVGLAEGGLDFLPLSLRENLRFKGCARILQVVAAEPVMSSLLEAGFLLLPYDEWNQAPRPCSAEELVKKYERMMAKQGPIGSLGALELLIPETDVMYYNGRWRPAKVQSGTFIARRERQFGSRSWCVVRLDAGVPTGLIGLPTANSKFRGYDEAWHLQQAIDYRRGKPQVFKLRHDIDGSSAFLDFFSPIPEWAHRRWNAVGERVAPNHCLFSYRFEPAVVLEEIRFAETRMWLMKND